MIFKWIMRKHTARWIENIMYKLSHEISRRFVLTDNDKIPRSRLGSPKSRRCRIFPNNLAKVAYAEKEYLLFFFNFLSNILTDFGNLLTFLSESVIFNFIIPVLGGRVS